MKQNSFDQSVHIKSAITQTNVLTTSDEKHTIFNHRISCINFRVLMASDLFSGSGRSSSTKPIKIQWFLSVKKMHSLIGIWVQSLRKLYYWVEPLDQTNKQQTFCVISNENRIPPPIWIMVSLWNVIQPEWFQFITQSPEKSSSTLILSLAEYRYLDRGSNHSEIIWNCLGFLGHFGLPEFPTKLFLGKSFVLSSGNHSNSQKFSNNFWVDRPN